MYFRDPKKELPKAYEYVLIKFKSSISSVYDIACYSDITKRWHPEYDNEISYDAKSPVGWMPLSELDFIETR